MLDSGRSISPRLGARLCAAPQHDRLGPARQRSRASLDEVSKPCKMYFRIRPSWTYVFDKDGHSPGQNVESTPLFAPGGRARFLQSDGRNAPRHFLEAQIRDYRRSIYCYKCDPANRLHIDLSRETLTVPSTIRWHVESSEGKAIRTFAKPFSSPSRKRRMPTRRKH